MAIINMASSEAEALERGVNVRSIDANGDGKVIMWLYDTHVGLCLEDRERNGYDDSDWDMLVWNEEKGATEWVMDFASTRGWSYPCMGSRPDATPEVRAKYEAYAEKQATAARKLAEERRAAMPAKGKTLRVVKGRKVPVGTEGPCMWSDTRFKTDKVLGVLFLGYEGRVGIRTAAGVVFTDASNCEVLA